MTLRPKTALSGGLAALLLSTTWLAGCPKRNPLFDEPGGDVPGVPPNPDASCPDTIPEAGSPCLQGRDACHWAVPISCRPQTVRGTCPSGQWLLTEPDPPCSAAPRAAEPPRPEPRAAQTPDRRDGGTDLDGPQRTPVHGTECSGASLCTYPVQGSPCRATTPALCVGGRWLVVDSPCPDAPDAAVGPPDAAGWFDAGFGAEAGPEPDAAPDSAWLEDDAG